MYTDLIPTHYHIQIVPFFSLGSLDSSSPNWDTLSAALDTSRHSTCSLDLLLSDLGGGDGRRVTVSVYLGKSLLVIDTQLADTQLADTQLADTQLY